ncbi:MAG: hypothetical protein U0521_06430 [Anaerolineae bacterium]
MKSLRTALSDAMLFARRIDFTTALSVADCGERLLALSDEGKLEYPQRLATVQNETPERAQFELWRVGYTGRIGKHPFPTMRIVGSLTRDDTSGEARVVADARLGSFMPLIALIFIIVTITSIPTLLNSTVDQWFALLLTVGFFAGSLYYTVGIGLEYRALRAQLYQTLHTDEMTRP